jgi:hypothetical protein
MPWHGYFDKTGPPTAHTAILINVSCFHLPPYLKRAAFCFYQNNSFDRHVPAIQVPILFCVCTDYQNAHAGQLII